MKYLKAKLKFMWGLLVISLVFCSSALGLTFSLPQEGDLVGKLQTTTVRTGESLPDIGRRFNVGVYEMIEANPNLDPWIPTIGATVLIPTQFILPKGPRVGLVLNLAEMRLYFFHPDKRFVTTYPFGIGKKRWSTPLGQSVITHKKKDPPWHPPLSIRKEHLAKGEVLPRVVQGGIPDNPLGLYALYLSKKGLSIDGAFLIHGTNATTGVGVRVTHGCIRLLPEDIKSLFYKVPVGTPVRIIHEPYKAGWHQGHLFLEAHQPLTEAQYAGSASLVRLEKIIKAAAIRRRDRINWASAKLAATAATGYPVRID